MKKINFSSAHMLKLKKNANLLGLSILFSFFFVSLSAQSLEAVMTPAGQDVPAIAIKNAVAAGETLVDTDTASQLLGAEASQLRSSIANTNSDVEENLLKIRFDFYAKVVSEIKSGLSVEEALNAGWFALKSKQASLPTGFSVNVETIFNETVDLLTI